MKKWLSAAAGLLCSLCVSAQVPAHLEIETVEENPDFITASVCFGATSQWYLSLLTQEALAGSSLDINVGKRQANRELRTWESYLLANLAQQTPEMQQDYRHRISGGQNHAEQVLAQSGYGALKDLLWKECQSWFSGNPSLGLDPLDAGVTFPLKPAALDLGESNILRCLGIAEGLRVMEGPMGVVRSNGWRQLFADKMTAVGLDPGEVSGRMAEVATREFEDLYRRTIVAASNDDPSPAVEAEAFCAGFETS